MPTSKPRPVPLKVGDRVRHLRGHITSPTHGELVPGALGVVLEVVPPVQGTGIYFEELDGVDEGRDGYARVAFEGWAKPLALGPDGEGCTWERA